MPGRTQRKAEGLRKHGCFRLRNHRSGSGGFFRLFWRIQGNDLRRFDFRLNIAKNMGFSVCNMNTEDFSAKAREYFGEAPSIKGMTADIDCFIDAAGAESILELYMEQGKIDSRFVSVAVNKASRKLDLLHLTYAQKSIIGSGGYMPEDVHDVMNIMASGRWDLESMITHEFPIDDLAKAIETAADASKALNVTIRFSSFS